MIRFAVCATARDVGLSYSSIKWTSIFLAARKSTTVVHDFNAECSFQDRVRFSKLLRAVRSTLVSMLNLVQRSGPFSSRGVACVSDFLALGCFWPSWSTTFWHNDSVSASFRLDCDYITVLRQTTASHMHRLGKIGFDLRRHEMSLDPRRIFSQLIVEFGAECQLNFQFRKNSTF